MACISTDCPRFAECAHAVQKGYIGEVTSWTSFASGGCDASGNSWIKHACGPLGGYAMFEPIHEDGDSDV